MNLEEISIVAMEIIAYAGNAKSCYMNALKQYKQKAMQKGNEYFQSGDKAMLIAHKSHHKLLTKEMNEQQPQISLLLAHAEDQLMNTETIKILVEEMKEIYISGGKNNE